MQASGLRALGSLALLACLIASACGGSAPNASGSGSVAVTSSQAPTASDVASPTGSSPAPAASPGLTGSCATAEAAGGVELTVTDPDLTARLPDGWRPVTPDEYLTQFAAFAEAFNDPSLDAAYQWQRRRVEAGIVRTLGSGQAPGGASTFVGIEIVPLVTDLETTVDATVADFATMGLPVVPESAGLTDLPVGPGACASYTVDYALGVPSRTTLFFALLPSGEVAIVQGTAPTEDSGFPAVVRSVAESLSAG